MKIEEKIKAAAKKYGTKTIKGYMAWEQEQIGSKIKSFEDGAKWAQENLSKSDTNENIII